MAIPYLIFLAAQSHGSVSLVRMRTAPEGRIRSLTRSVTAKPGYRCQPRLTPALAARSRIMASDAIPAPLLRQKSRLFLWWCSDALAYSSAGGASVRATDAFSDHSGSA